MSNDQVRKLAARLLKSRMPSARKYAAYRESADAFYWAHFGNGPCFRARVRNGQQLTGRPSLRTSVLFKQDYLVAWVDDDAAFAAAFRDDDAITTPIPPPFPENGPVPLILAPKRRRGSRSERFTSILEHEIVHANQIIIGLSFPEWEAQSQDELLDRFFPYTQLEFEAHLIQSVHWPPKLTFGKVVLTLGEWALLRAYTPAIEEILSAAIAGRIPPRILPHFLDAVPSAAAARLRKIGCWPELVEWFRKRWRSDVATAALRVFPSSKPDKRQEVARIVHGWLSNPR